MSSDRWAIQVGRPDAASGATRPVRADHRRENESRTKDDEPGAATVNDVVGSPGFGGTRLFSGADKIMRRNDSGG